MRGFKSLLLRHFFIYAQIAQSVEQRTENPRVGGSIPPLGTNITPVRRPERTRVLQTRNNRRSESDEDHNKPVRLWEHPPWDGLRINSMRNRLLIKIADYK